MNKTFLVTAGILGAISVIAGAFGAHALKSRMPAGAFEIFETAVKYQFYHVFALLAVGILTHYIPGNLITWSGRLFIAGIILFCCSLYLLAYFKTVDNQQMNWLGAVTPFGGLCFIAGWIFLALAVLKS